MKLQLILPVEQVKKEGMALATHLRKLANQVARGEYTINTYSVGEEVAFELNNKEET